MNCIIRFNNPVGGLKPPSGRTTFSWHYPSLSLLIYILVRKPALKDAALRRAHVSVEQRDKSPALTEADVRVLSMSCISNTEMPNIKDDEP